MEPIGITLIVLAVIFLLYTILQLIGSSEQKEPVDKIYLVLNTLVVSAAAALIGAAFLFYHQQ